MNGGRRVSRVYHYNRLWDKYVFTGSRDCQEDDESDWVSEDIEPEYLAWLDDFQRVACDCDTCKRDERFQELARIRLELDRVRESTQRTGQELTRVSEELDSVGERVKELLASCTLSASASASASSFS
jgi:hypothetical protein